ncbi:MAG TPA: SDR family NAD(P)-dependent oxidoreductase, partial [Steroidobacteraceae bacterium]|nr:SDR family NAD(P)-dependent oxidoreductase [Steroidobacteraceae bacterium]
MDLGISGCAAVVTGASRGLGRAIALALAHEGVRVTAVARQQDRLEALTREPVPSGPGAISARAVDLADAAALEGMRELVSSAQILVINTGGPPPGAAADISDALWVRQFESLFLSAVRLARFALPGMRARSFGRIILVVSSGIVQPIPNLAISNALRLALVGWAKTLASEVAAAGITVNCIAPGRIATDRVAEIDRLAAERQGMSLEEVQRQSRLSIPAA